MLGDDPGQGPPLDEKPSPNSAKALTTGCDRDDGRSDSFSLEDKDIYTVRLERSVKRDEL